MSVVVEWDVVDPREEPPVDRHGLLTSHRTCVDGDVQCDADGSRNGSCTFEVSACVNVADPRLAGAGCAPSDVSVITVRRPRPNDPVPERAAAGVVLRDILAALAPSTTSGSGGEVVTYTSPVAAELACTAAGNVVVPLGGARRKTLAVSIQGETSAGLKDPDVLKLRCVAAE